MEGRTQRLLVAAVMGLATAGVVGGGNGAQAEENTSVACYGINKCKGTGDCGGKGHGCAGLNECAGQAFIKLEKDTCLKIQGGRLTPEPEAS